MAQFVMCTETVSIDVSSNLCYGRELSVKESIVMKPCRRVFSNVYLASYQFHVENMLHNITYTWIWQLHMRACSSIRPIVSTILDYIVI